MFHNTIRNSFSYTTDIIKWKGNFSIFIERNISSLETEKQFLLVFVIAVLKMNTMILFLFNFFFNLFLFFITIAHAFKWKPLSNFVTIKLIFPKWILKHFRFYEGCCPGSLWSSENSTVWEYVQNIWYLLYIVCAILKWKLNPKVGIVYI